MPEEVKRLSVFEIITTDAAITPTSGDKVFEHIVNIIESQSRVIIDFKDINYINSAFLNAAIGQLYNKYSREILNSFIKFDNLSGTDVTLLLKVIERAREYFTDKKKFENRNKDILNE